MKLLILQDHLRVGGTERQSLFLARSCREAGHDVCLMVFRPGGHLATPENLGSMEMKVLQSFDSKLSFWAPGLLREIRRTAPDIVLCMGRTANCYAGFIQRKFPALPVVGTLRTGKVLFPLHRWSMGIVKAVLVNSNWWKRRLQERDFPEERIHVVHNAVLLDRSEVDRQKLRQEMRDRYAVPDDTCVFLNVATFRPGKRHIDLLRIFLTLRVQYPDLPWRLWLVGDGKEYRRCKHWVARKGLGTRVRFFHFQHDPFPYYAAADIAVSASQEDSLPNFLVEAQATGLPVVAYDCRGVNETCMPGKTGEILEAGDSSSFLNQLVRFTSDPAVRAEYAETAPAFAEERFSRKPQANSIIRFLEGLIP